MNILFHETFLNKRGTSIALFDYAYHNQKILGNKSYIVSDINKPNDEDVLKKFKSNFHVFHYNNFNDISKILTENNIDVFYIIKSGENDGMLLPNIKNVVHSVFCGDPVQKHGDVYATVSEWLSSLSDFKIPYVPHMINLPKTEEDFRKELNISNSDVVIGRHGGRETFDIPFVKNEIIKILNSRSDILFLFLNTENFINHPRVIYLDSTVDMFYKTKFINTCDAMLHARSQGETFGLSVLEFASKNKHIITYGNSRERSHLSYLDKNCSIYRDENELSQILNNITRDNPYNTSYLNEVFSPSNVMDKFKNVFL